MTVTLSKQQLANLVGQDLGVSGWIEIDQDRINTFAEVTLDRQFIHVDPARAAKETGFGGTIAHGFLTLSLLTHFARQFNWPLEGTVMGINYGFNRVRFLAPVSAGARVRGRGRLVAISEREPGQVLSESEITVEIEGQSKPALVAAWLTLSILRSRSPTEAPGP
jgi:acyl dehydratase